MVNKATRDWTGLKRESLNGLQPGDVLNIVGGRRPRLPLIGSACIVGWPHRVKRPQKCVVGWPHPTTFYRAVRNPEAVPKIIQIAASLRSSQ